jgi:Raf kinase inhibitor-like YbhB/YbcL family protein
MATQTQTIRVTSTAFQPNAKIPKKHAYAGEGQNASPPLAWTGVPANAKELALICDDPDAPRPQPWVHWVIYRVPAATKGLPEGIEAKPGPLANPPGAMQGKNTWDEVGWGGPLPPPGHGIHHYRFHVYALDTHLQLMAGATKEALLKAIEGHVVADGELVGTYERK